MRIRVLSLILSIVITLGLIPVTTSAYANQKEIYVSIKDGDDNGNGTKEKPYKTIDRARQDASAGDTIVLKEGVYNNKIVFWEAHGAENIPYKIKGEDGANVVISSYEGITSKWEHYKENIYRTNIGKKDDVSHALIFDNGKYDNLVEARWPNAPADDVLNMERGIMDDGSDHYGIVDDSLPDGDWTGATAYIWTGKVYEQYLSYARVITEYNAGKNLKFDYVGEESDTYTPQKGDWYYLTNSLEGLDVQKEYFYDKETGYFYIIMPDNEAPDSGEIQIQSRDNAIELWNSDYIAFENLNIIGGGVVVHDSNNCTFDNVNVYYSDFFRTNDGYNTHVNAYNSTRLCGDNNTWKNSEIAYTMSSGILINGDGNTVINCKIHDVNIGGGYNAAISIEGDCDNTTISHNELYKSGRFLIYFINTGNFGDGYDNTVIEYNDCYEAMYLTRDGGVIYGYHRDGKGVTIKNNWVHDSMKPSCGIYLDNECYNFTVRNNVVWNISETGIVINNSSLNNIIYRNTVFDCKEGIQGWPKTGEYSQKGTIIANNAVNPTAEFITGANAPTLISNAFATDFKIDENFLPSENSPLVDEGTVVDGIIDDYAGSAPDIGAYERNGDYWIAGTLDKTVSGDANFDGKVSIADVLCMKKRLANIPVTVNVSATDVTGDNEFDLADVLLMQKYLANYPVTLYKRTV